MARTYKQPSLVSGMSVADIMNMDNRTFNKLSASDLRKVVGRLVSAGNKRIRNLQKGGYTTPALRGLEKTGGVLSTKGKDLNALRSEYARARNFLASKTSTKAGYIDVRNETIKEIKRRQKLDIRAAAVNDVETQLQNMGKTVKDIGKREYNKMVEKALDERFDKIFRSYETLKEIDPSVSNRGLKYQTLKEITETITDNPELNVDEIAETISDQIKQIYEEQAQLNYGDQSVSDFFEM